MDGVGGDGSGDVTRPGARESADGEWEAEWRRVVEEWGATTAAYPEEPV